MSKMLPIRRALSNGRFALPEARGEPFLNYAPGSSERSALESALRKVIGFNQPSYFHKWKP